MNNLLISENKIDFNDAIDLTLIENIYNKYFFEGLYGDFKEYAKEQDFNNALATVTNSIKSVYKSKMEGFNDELTLKRGVLGGVIFYAFFGDPTDIISDQNSYYKQGEEALGCMIKFLKEIKSDSDINDKDLLKVFFFLCIFIFNFISDEFLKDEVLLKYIKKEYFS